MQNYKFPVFKAVLLSSFIILGFWISESNEITFEEDVTLSTEEKKTLDKFKALMMDRLPHDYMKEDIYLVRWLRARYFNIRDAETFLMEHLKWREVNRMDDIFNEDWSDMDRDYRYWLEGRDKEGKPLLYVNGGVWDLRRAAVSGGTDRFNRYIDKGFEDACGLVRELGTKYHNISRGILIVNTAGFSLQQHACLPCLQSFLRIIITYEAHHPGCADKIIFVNLPQAAEFIIAPARQLLHPDTNRAIHLFGTNKAIWQKALRQWFWPDQLPPELGGTKLYQGMDDELSNDY